MPPVQPPPPPPVRVGAAPVVPTKRRINSKAKGSAGEHEAIALLTSWGQAVGHTLILERNLEQVRKGGSDINGVPGLEIEVKRVEDGSVPSFWAQVCRAAERQGTHPLLMHRKNRQPWKFRTRLYGAFYGPAASGVVPLVVDLEIDAAKVWFQGYLHYMAAK